MHTSSNTYPGQSTSLISLTLTTSIGKKSPGMTFLCRQKHDMVWVHHHSKKHGRRMLGRDRTHSAGSIPVKCSTWVRRTVLWDHSLSLQMLERKTVFMAWLTPWLWLVFSGDPSIFLWCLREFSARKFPNGVSWISSYSYVKCICSALFCFRRGICLC